MIETTEKTRKFLEPFKVLELFQIESDQGIYLHHQARDVVRKGSLKEVFTLHTEPLTPESFDRLVSGVLLP